MKPLDCNYTANGKSFRILKREGDYCIAEQTGTPYKEYEVFRVRHQKGGVVLPGGYISKEAERVPSNSEWGLYGWSWPSKYKHLAEQKFDQLVNNKSAQGTPKQRSSIEQLSPVVSTLTQCGKGGPLTVISPNMFYRANELVWVVEKREGDIVLAKRADGNHFEVFQVQQQEAHESAGIEFKAKELPPSNSQWGLTGFTFIKRHSAERWFRAMVRCEQAGDKINKANIRQQQTNKLEHPAAVGLKQCG
jgi:hypothetical protein